MESIDVKIDFLLQGEMRAIDLPAKWVFRSPKRGYEMCIETDLLGGFWLFRRWWGLFNRRKGQMKSQYVNIYQAWAVTQDVARKRLKHGYHTVAEPEISDAKRTELDQKARAQTSSTPFFASEQYRMIKKRAMHPNSLIRAGKEGVQLSLL